jgi:hypothetical protein
MGAAGVTIVKGIHSCIYWHEGSLSFRDFVEEQAETGCKGGNGRE